MCSQVLRNNVCHSCRCCAEFLSVLCFAEGVRFSRSARAQGSPVAFQPRCTTSTASCRIRGALLGGRSSWLYPCTSASLWRIRACGSSVASFPCWALCGCCLSSNWNLWAVCIACPTVPMPCASVPWFSGWCCSCTTTLSLDFFNKNIRFSWTRYASIRQTQTFKERASHT